MRFILNFSPNTEPVPTANQEHLNSFIHKCLGENNSYHDTSSNYSISGLLGGEYNADSETLEFKNGGIVVVSSIESNGFLNDILKGALNNPVLNWGMEYKNADFIYEDFFDNFNTFHTLSPILLKEITGKNTYKYITADNPDFDDILTAKTLNRLQRVNNLHNLKLNFKGFKITTSTNGKNKVKKVMVKNVLNYASDCVFTVHGNKKVAELIYNIGIGQSTGSGFGTVCGVDHFSRYKR